MWPSKYIEELEHRLSFTVIEYIYNSLVNMVLKIQSALNKLILIDVYPFCK